VRLGAETRGAIAGRAALDRRLALEIDTRAYRREKWRSLRPKNPAPVPTEVVDPFAASFRPIVAAEILPQPPSIAPSYPPSSPSETLRKVLPQGGFFLRALESAVPILHHLETPARVALILATIGAIAKEARSQTVTIDVSGMIDSAKAAVTRTAESLGLDLLSTPAGVKLAEATTSQTFELVKQDPPTPTPAADSCDKTCKESGYLLGGICRPEVPSGWSACDQKIEKEHESRRDGCGIKYRCCCFLSRFKLFLPLLSKGQR
jgi:hypothetical protein